MTTPRSSPYMYATWPTKYLAGDKSCLWACWFKTHYQGHEKAPSDFNLVRWQAEHTVLLNALIDELEGQDCEVFIEHPKLVQGREPEVRTHGERQARPDSEVSGRQDRDL